MNKPGKAAEKAAENFLQRQGYNIITKNYRSRYGEIDIIAEDSGVLCFVEVKSRAYNYFGTPEEKVNIKKQKKIIG